MANDKEAPKLGMKLDDYAAEWDKQNGVEPVVSEGQAMRRKAKQDLDEEGEEFARAFKESESN